MSENRNLQDNHHRLFMSRTSNIDAQIEQLKNQCDIVDGRNHKRWQDLKRCCDEMASTEHSHWQKRNEENKTIQQSMSRVEDNIEWVTHELAQLRDRNEQIDEWNRERWQDLKKRTDKIEATGFSHRQKSNQESRAIVQSISRMKENMDESVTKLTERLDVLLRENDTLKRKCQMQNRTMNSLKSDIDKVQEEHDALKKGAISVLIGSFVLYFCYKLFSPNDPPLLPMELHTLPAASFPTPPPPLQSPSELFDKSLLLKSFVKGIYDSFEL